MLLLFLLLMPCSVLFSTITEIADFNTLKMTLNQFQEDDLIVFDIDCTLLIPQDKVLRPCGKHYFLKHFANLNQLLTPEKIQRLTSIILQNRTLTLVDAEMPAWIKALNKQCKAIAITTLSSGKLGEISSIEEWRKNELVANGFDFSQAFVKYPHIVFGDHMVNENIPVFQHGILFTAGQSKADMLEALLRRVKWQPKRVICIDDNREHLEAIDVKMERAEIECLCIHYTQTALFDDFCQEKIALEQFVHLVKHEKWLADSTFEAKPQSLLKLQITSQIPILTNLQMQ